MSEVIRLSFFIGKKNENQNRTLIHGTIKQYGGVIEDE
jgi:hypothetical protein